MPDRNAELFVKMYSKLQLALGGGKSPGAGADRDQALEKLLGEPAPGPTSPLSAAAGQDVQSLLTIYNPGQYLPPDLDPGKMEDLYSLSLLFDAVPKFSWFFKPDGIPISEVYNSILRGKEPPLTQITPDQQKKLEAAIRKEKDLRDGYEEYMNKYLEARMAYDGAYATWKNGGPSIPANIEVKLENAFKNWGAQGRKSAYESARATIATYDAMEPETFWNDLTNRYQEGARKTQSGSTFQPYDLSPPYKTWFQDSGWTDFHFYQLDLDRQTESEAIGVAGTLDVKYGIFSLSGTAEWSKNREYLKADQAELAFSCQLKRVTMSSRSWMNPLVLWSRAWRWQQGAGYADEISTGGDLYAGVRPEGSMTVIPVAAILSRNLHVHGSFTATEVETLNEMIKARGSIGFGPFSLSGSFHMENHSGFVKSSITSGGINAPDVQIIGLQCAVLPKCPNPDPTLPWPTT